MVFITGRRSSVEMKWQCCTKNMATRTWKKYSSNGTPVPHHCHCHCCSHYHCHSCSMVPPTPPLPLLLLLLLQFLIFPILLLVLLLLLLLLLLLPSMLCSCSDVFCSFLSSPKPGTNIPSLNFGFIADTVLAPRQWPFCQPFDGSCSY